MRTLKLIEHISLDGVMQSSGENGFPYENWTAPYRTPTGAALVLAEHGDHFANGTPARTFTLEKTQALPTGILVNSYRAAGPLQKQG